MSKKKPRKRKLKIVLLVLAGLAAAFGLFAGYFFLSLPDTAALEKNNPATTALIEMRKAEALEKKQKFTLHQEWVNFDRIPQLLKNTVRVSEDIDFYYHKGIDYYELKESLKRNLKEGKIARGGSTITQQLAKNLYLSTGKSYYRKLKEFFIAKRLEKHLTKDRIFNIYLNVIEFGKGVFGVGAASRYFFRKPVGSLKLEEILRLVAVIPKPLKVTPLSESRYLKWRVDLLLERMLKYGYITEGQYAHARGRFR